MVGVGAGWDHRHVVAIAVAVRVMVLGALVLALVAIVMRMLVLVLGARAVVCVVAVAVVVQVMVLRRCRCRSCTLPLSSHVVGVVSLWHWPSASPRRCRRVGVALAVCITSSSSRRGICHGSHVFVVFVLLPWMCHRCRRRCAGAGAGVGTGAGAIVVWVMTLVLDRHRVGDGHGTGDGMVMVVVVRMLVLESSSLGSCRHYRVGAWVVVGSHGCSSWSGHRLPHDGIDQKPNSPKTIWMSPWPETSRLKLKAGG